MIGGHYVKPGGMSMKQKKSSKGRLMRNLAKSKGVKRRVAKPETKPKFLIAAEEKAHQLDIPVEDILNDDLHRMRKSKYPGPDCLEPYEVEEFVAAGELSDDILSHIDTCDPCKALLLSAKPKKEALQAFLEDVRYYVSQMEAQIIREKQGEKMSDRMASVASNSPR